MDVEQKILRLLFEEGKMNYRSIVDTGIHPNITRRELDRLKQMGLVREEGRKTWRRGKPLFYSLTEKGEETTINMLLDDLKEILKITERMLGKIVSQPATIEKWRKAVRGRPFKIEITEDTSLEEVRSIAKKEMEEVGYGALHRCLWLMHHIVKMMSSKIFLKTDVFIHVSEEGAVTIVPKALLKEKGVLRA